MRSMPASPNAELVKALGRRDLAEAEAAARDLERVEPEHALAIVLLMADEDDVRYEPSLIRWVGLWLSRHPQVGLELAVDLVRSLAGLTGASPNVARASAGVVLRSVGDGASASVLAHW
jgi:hypothetical protein